MSEQVNVKVGQVWRDNDPRQQTTVRLLTVKEIVGGRATCEVTIPGQKTKRTKVRLDRFRPTQTGYRLEKDVEAAPSTS